MNTPSRTRTPGAAPAVPAAKSAGPVDVGLLILRVGVAAALLHACLIKLLDYPTTVQFMTDAGWRLPAFAALMVTATELLSGLGLLLGVCTPLAGCAGLGAMLCAWAVNVSGAAVWSDPFNVPFLIGLACAALIFAGAGSYSADERLLARFAWSPRMKTALVALAVIAAFVTWVALYGVNPIHFSAPPAAPGPG